jgi:putative transposase
MSVAGVKLRRMKAGRRFRAELTEAQVQLAQQTADVCRAVWNAGLEQRREYRRRGAWINYEKQAQELVEAKKGTLLAYRSAVALPAAGAP